MQLLLLLCLSRYLNPASLIPKPIPQPILGLLNPQGASGKGGPATCPSPAPAHVTWPQASHFLFLLHITFKFQVLILPALPLPAISTTIFSPSNLNPQLQPLPPTWALQGVLTPGARRRSIHLLLPGPTSDGQA